MCLAARPGKPAPASPAPSSAPTRLGLLEDRPGLRHFVSDMARANRGRALYVTPDRLGEYILVDYVTGRQKRVG